jgi:hypothetical protein
VMRIGRRSSDLVGPAFAAVYAGGFAISGYFQLADWRTVLIGAHHVAPVAALALLAAVSLLAWVSLSGRRAVWMSPAQLTWHDSDDRRVAVLRRRLIAAWGWRVVAVSYVWTMAAALIQASSLVWMVGTAGGLVVAVMALLALGPGRTARRAGRPELVAGWHRRTVRSVAARYLDPMLLLEAARPVGLSLAGASILRYMTVAVTGRGDALLLALLVLGVALALLQLAPALPASLVLAILGYLSLLPTAGGLARLWRYPGLRRWSAASDLRLRGTAAVTLAVPALVWCAVAVLFGAPVAALAVAPIIVAAIVRTVTRPPPRYDVPSPVFLMIQAMRGADLLMLSTTVLLLGLAPVITATVIVILTASGILT